MTIYASPDADRLQFIKDLGHCGAQIDNVSLNVLC